MALELAIPWIQHSFEMIYFQFRLLNLKFTDNKDMRYFEIGGKIKYYIKPENALKCYQCLILVFLYKRSVDIQEET